MIRKRFKQKRSVLARIFRTRLIFIILLVLIQGALYFLASINTKFQIIWAILHVVIITTMTLIIINSSWHRNNYKLAWIIPVLLMPVFGTVLYILTYLADSKAVFAEKSKKILEKTNKYFENDTDSILKYLPCEEKSMVHLASKTYWFPAYINYKSKYLSTGMEYFDALISDIKNAKKYIFLEYFIICEGKIWNEILSILKQKVKDGVEVRVMYDGTNVVKYVNFKYDEELTKYGIDVRVFSRLSLSYDSYLNDRDHRKIAIIDGLVAYTGGLNLHDEYAGLTNNYSSFKDGGVRLTGSIVNSFIIMFLHLWDLELDDMSDYKKYVIKNSVASELEGLSEKEKNNLAYAIPYSHYPRFGQMVAESFILSLINYATEYIYIYTPYLIMDEVMEQALIQAANRGVSVHLILPKEPGKIYTYVLAHSHYKKLIKNNINIYEYPGMVHFKNFLSDDKRGIIGSINLDYRSMFLDYENAVYFYNDPILKDMKSDMEDTIKKSKKFTMADVKKFSALEKIAAAVMKLIAPLM